MSHLFNQLALIIGLVLVAMGSLLGSRDSAFWVLVAIGIGLVVQAIVGDRKRVIREKEQRNGAIDARVAELTSMPWPNHQKLVIPGNDWLVLLFALMVFALGWWLWIMSAEPSLPVVNFLAAAFMLAISLIALVGSLARVGKPAIELDRDGFVTPIHGRIPWKAIDGIDLQQYKNRGTTSYLLSFLVRDYRHVVSTIHWTQKVLALFRLGALKSNVIVVQLRDSGEKPETVYAAARFLRKQATGFDHDWSPMLSAAYNAAARRMATYKVSDDPEQMLAELEQINKDLATMRAEQARPQSGLGWLLLVGIVLMLLMFIVVLLKWL